MQLKTDCADCKTTGYVKGFDLRVPGEIVCERCNGAGFTVKDIVGSELADILSKLDEIKTKSNQMQADINYLKAKVG